MTKVFVLQHVARQDAADKNVKFVGVYSTESAAQEAVNRLKSQPGFANFPDGFHIDWHELNHDHWAEGFVSE